MPTPVRLVERRNRRLVLESSPDRGILGCGGVFLFLAFSLTVWALENDLARMPLVDSCYLLILDAVLLYLGAYALWLPLGTRQTLALDKNLNGVSVTTRGLFKTASERYRLDEVIKVHHNRVDDGTFDPNALLLIFRGGGAIQFPPGGGQPKTTALLADVVAEFLDVNRSDAAPKQVLPRVPRRVRAAWEPRGTGQLKDY